MLPKCPGETDVFKELRVRFVMFQKIIISKTVFVSNNFVSDGTRKPPNGPSKNLLGNQTGFLEARSGVYVFRVSSVALQEERFSAPCTRKPPNGVSENLLKTTQGS